MNTAYRAQRPLRVLHQGRGRARLRFRCSEIAAWSVWLERGASLVLPAPAAIALTVETRFRDPFDGTSLTVPTALDRAPARLVAALVGTDSGYRFQVGQEPGDEPDCLDLSNLTDAGVRCVLRFNGTPFVLATHVPAQAGQTLDLTAWDLTVTVDGITGSTLPIGIWHGDIVLGASEADGRHFPTATLVAPPQQDTPLPRGDHHG